MPEFKIRKGVKKKNAPYMQSNTMDNADNALYNEMERTVDELPADQQERFRLMKEEKKNKGIEDLDSILATGLAAAAALIPAPEQESPLAPILESYNPNPQGTGSQAIMKKGGKIMEYFTGGNPPTGGGKGKKAPTPLERLRQLYDQRESQMVYGALDPYDYSSNTIALSKGKFRGAKVPKQMIQDAVATAKKHGLDPYDMLALIGQESTFGVGTGEQRARSKQELVSGWNLDEQYKTYPVERFLADQKVPGVASIKDNHGYQFYFEDEKKVMDYLNKNPNVLTAYEKKLAAQPKPQKLDYFDLAAQRIKKKGFASYNPGDKNYSKAVMESKKLLQSDPSLKGLIKMKDGGKIKTLSSNPYDGGTVEFVGPSHANGGIKLSSQVEVEGKETASMTNGGDITVFGNMKVPGTNKKFKDVVKMIGEEENKIMKTMKKGGKISKGLKTYDEFDRLSQNAADLMAMGAEQKLAKLAQSKQMLAMIQDSMLASESFTGKAKKGITLNDGEGDGKKKKPSMAQRHNNPGNIKWGEFARKHGAVKGEPATDGGYFAKFPDVQTGLKAMKGLLQTKNYKNLTVEQAVKRWTNQAGYSVDFNNIKGKKISELNSEELNQLHNLITVGEDGKYYSNKTDGSSAPQTATTQSTTSPVEQPVVNERPITDLVGEFKSQKIKYTDPNYQPTELGEINPVTGNPIGSAADKNALDFRQIAPEIFSIIKNKPEPVFAQKYSPDLFSQYEISLQDKLNENQSTFNALARTAQYNPSAMGTLAAQKYSADSQVLGEETRINQGIRNEIINKNVGLLNDAELKNLQIGDVQANRQSIARSKTRAQSQMAVNSISNKFLQNQLENNTIRTYEPLFDYRYTYDENGNIIGMGYQGPEADFNGGISPQQDQARVEKRYDANGNLLGSKTTTPTPARQQIDQARAQQSSFDALIYPFMRKKK